MTIGESHSAAYMHALLHVLDLLLGNTVLQRGLAIPRGEDAVQGPAHLAETQWHKDTEH